MRIAAALLALLPAVAQAQTQFPFSGRSTDPSAPPFAASALNAAGGTKMDYSGPMGLVPDAFRQSADGADDAPSFQRALGQACAGTSHVLRLRARVYRIASAITQPCAVHWIGQGWQEPNGGAGTATPGLGSWLQIVGVGFNPVTVTSPAAAGSSFEGFGVYQTHPTPGAGWTPTVYPWVFTVNGTNGEVTFRNLMFLAVSKGISGYYAGRIRIEHVRGQFFRQAVYLDKNYDTSIIDDLRGWPYWSQDANVLAYQQGSTDLIGLGRVDDSFVDHVFALGARSVLALSTSGADPVNPSALPGGSPTRLMVGAIRGDFVKWTIWNTAVSSAFDDVDVSISKLVHQGQVWGGTVPLTDSAAIRNDGTSTLISVAYLKGDMLDKAVVVGTNTGAASNVQIDQLIAIFSHSTAANCYLQMPGSVASTLKMGLPPLVDWGTHTPNLQPGGSTGTVTWNRPS